MKLELLATITTLTLFAVGLSPAGAQTPGGTLAKIRDAREISLGHRDVSIPFSYMDDQQKPVGFAMDRRMLMGVKERAERHRRAAVEAVGQACAPSSRGQ